MLADAVLLVHLTLVVFVVGGLPAIVIGNRLGWHWVNRWPFRGAHALAIGVIVAQAWLGQDCPLTLLENALRRRTGEAGYDAGGFIAHWAHALLFWSAPPWVFALGYTLFGATVAACWWRWPPTLDAAVDPGSHRLR